MFERAPAQFRDALENQSDTLFTVDKGEGSETYHLSRQFFDLSTQRHSLFIIKALTKAIVRKEAETWKKAIRVIGHEVNNSLAPISSLVLRALRPPAGANPPGDVVAAGPPDEATLSVSEPPGGGFEIRVEDRGKGMTEEVSKKALLPFYSTKATGTSLGLCREIVDAHGGRLSVHPRSDGGVRVVCWLP